MNQQPIFVLGAHKSGTTLLRNLLSGHKDLFAIPFESHFFQWMDRDVDYEYRKNRSKGLSVVEIEKNFHDWIKTSNSAVDPMGDTFVKDKLDVSLFYDKFKISEGDEDSEIFEKYMEAIHKSLGLGSLPDNIRVVEKSVENAEFAMELSQMFPEAKFVHIVRNPYSNFVSLRKYKSIGVGYPLLNRMVNTFKNSYHFLKENPRRIKNYKIIRYEDLLSDPKKCMSAIAEFLNIEFHEQLLYPTHLNRNWKGNSTTGSQFAGISREGMDKWKEEIHSIELACVNSIASSVLSDYCYEFVGAGKNYLNKVESEPFFRCIFNRWFVFRHT
ncbi:MAG: sulfotransferase [Flavobacteriales bacterium]|nr:sulfotransferase [Flavobacteriales bacterium]